MTEAQKRLYRALKERIMFEVGDRVRVYYTLGEKPITMKAKILFINAHGVLTVLPEISNEPARIVHSRQCRKLKKKEKRRIWVLKNEHSKPQLGHPLLDKVLFNHPPSLFEKCYDEFIEVKK